MTGAAAQPRRLAVLALLARAGRPGITREKILALLWPDEPEERARRSLNQAVYSLRRDLGDEDALLGAKDLRLNLDRIEVDTIELGQANALGRIWSSCGSVAPGSGRNPLVRPQLDLAARAVEATGRQRARR